MRSQSLVSLLTLTMALALAAPAMAARPQPITPMSVLGFQPGDDRKLASYAQVVDFFDKLAASSDRVRVERIGDSTLDRPMLLATITSPRNMARLDRLREIQRRLADPRTIATDAEAEAFMREGVAVVLITCGVHSTEVGSTLSSMSIAYRLASDDSPETAELLDRLVVLMVPSLNPDGVDIVKEWYDSTLGTPYEGSDPPELYHRYAGHDTNRDWYAFELAETRAVVDRVHNTWHPQVVNDIHQQGQTGSRLYLPPYVDPIEPNVPPEIVAGVNALGTSVAWGMTASGRTGVVTDAIFDGWTPARAYSHYHGGIRILSETASARLATPVHIEKTALGPGRGFDARRASANFPAPWQGGDWKLADIVDYMTTSSLMLLRECSSRRSELLHGFYRIGREAVTHRPGEPVAYVIAPEPALLTGDGDAGRAVHDSARTALLSTLARGGVEIDVASRPFEAGGASYPEGAAIVRFDQPYGGFAKALLEKQVYPDIRLYAGGPPVPPYDVTAHTMSLLCGYEAVRIDAPFDVSASSRWVMPGKSPLPELRQLRDRRIGVFRGATGSMDEGWLRYVLDTWGVSYASIDEPDIRVGSLRKRFDTIVLPDMAASDIASGLTSGSAPAKYVGGVGAEGAAAFKAFVEAGGTLVALNQSSDYAISTLGLPMRDELGTVPSSTFYCPGSILRLDVAEEAVSAGIARSSIAWFEQGPGFAIDSNAAGVRVIARFAPADKLLVSGWLLGADRLAGRPALVEVRQGKGLAILFAFRPHYRGQSIATLPFLFNALAAGS